MNVYLGRSNPLTLQLLIICLIVKFHFICSSQISKLIHLSKQKKIYSVAVVLPAHSDHSEFGFSALLQVRQEFSIVEFFILFW